MVSGTARLVLLLTGGTGVTAKTNQIQADHFAQEGYFVVMPDLYACCIFVLLWLKLIITLGSMVNLIVRGN